jgi:hypothetical protein
MPDSSAVLNSTVGKTASAIGAAANNASTPAVFARRISTTS